MPQRRNEVRVSGSGSLRRYAMGRGPLDERAGIAMIGRQGNAAHAVAAAVGGKGRRLRRLALRSDSAPPFGQESVDPAQPLINEQGRCQWGCQADERRTGYSWQAATPSGAAQHEYWSDERCANENGRRVTAVAAVLQGAFTSSGLPALRR